jgi:Raf kinase inhibitor-like YbhB/YbcL family protein
MSLTLTSTAFAHNAEIPSIFTCDGRGTSPPLAWSGAPPAAKCLALIVDDPDAPDPRAPKTTWVHWVLYDIPTSLGGLAQGTSAKLPAGVREGVNDWKRTGWGGPCPPVGRHRYFFKLFALDTLLGDLHAPTKPALERAMTGHILTRAELVGTYQKKK